MMFDSSGILGLYILVSDIKRLYILELIMSTTTISTPIFVDILLDEDNS